MDGRISGVEELVGSLSKTIENACITDEGGEMIISDAEESIVAQVAAGDDLPGKLTGPGQLTGQVRG